MKFVLIIFGIIFCSFSFSYVKSHYPLEEVLTYETSLIETSCNAVELSNALASRGECYLVDNQIEKALDDFKESYRFASEAIEEEKLNLELRLFLA